MLTKRLFEAIAQTSRGKVLKHTNTKHKPQRNNITLIAQRSDKQTPSLFKARINQAALSLESGQSKPC